MAHPWIHPFPWAVSCPSRSSQGDVTGLPRGADPGNEGKPQVSIHLGEVLLNHKHKNIRSTTTKNRKTRKQKLIDSGKIKSCQRSRLRYNMSKDADSNENLVKNTEEKWGKNKNTMKMSKGLVKTAERKAKQKRPTHVWLVTKMNRLTFKLKSKKILQKYRPESLKRPS